MVYRADLILHSHNASRPILLLEEFESLLSSISCDEGTGVITLRFLSKDDAQFAASAWRVPEMVVVTNHPLEGCGPAGDRMPYLLADLPRKLIGLYRGRRKLIFVLG